MTDEKVAQSAWYTVTFLTVAYALSCLDRFIMLLLVTPLQQDMALSNVQVGLLYGLGFGVVYTLTGLPFAHAMDRGRRVIFVAVGVTLWSATTVASGFASNYMILLALRSGTAIGEAVLTPAAISMIGDLFPRDRRALPTSLYVATGAWMSSGAFVIGAIALSASSLLIPYIPLAPWRLTLILVGIPGIILGPIFWLTVREPKRRESKAASDIGHVSAAEIFAYIGRDGRIWMYLFAIMAIMTTGNYGVATWTMTMLVKEHLMPAATAGYYYGLVGLVGAVVGTATWPWLATQWARRGRKDAILTLLALAIALNVWCVLLIGLSPSVGMVLMAVSVQMFCVGAMASLPPMIIQTMGPSRMRARLAAGNLLAQGLIAGSAGPWAPAFFSEHVLHGPHALGQGIAATGAIVFILVVPCLWRTRGWYMKAWYAATLP